VANKTDAKLDAILAALTALDSRVSAIETAPAPTVKTETPRANRRQNRSTVKSETPKNTAPKATSCVVSGTIIRFARNKYGALVQTDTGEKWANSQVRGAGRAILPSLLASFNVGDTLTVTVDEHGIIVPSETAKAEQPAVKTPRGRRATKTQIGDTGAYIVETPAIVAQTALVAPTVKPARQHNATCPICKGGDHKNYSIKQITRDCAAEQFKTATGLDADENMVEFATWFTAEPRLVFAKNATGSRFAGGPKNLTVKPVTTPGIKTSGKNQPPAPKSQPRDRKVAAYRKAHKNAGAIRARLARTA
jgi:hypothetical protein